MNKIALLLSITLCIIVSCEQKTNESRNMPINDIAGNNDVKHYMESFKGLGSMSDGTLPKGPQESLGDFVLAEDLELDLVLSEPQITQPVDISFDHRGRLWVVQYNQYPYPEGVKVVDIDNHNRVVFDKTPKPPPEGIKGADKITVFEDTNNDGVFDKSTDAITGLNITTGVVLGRGKIWVLTPPYLVAYPDHNGDGIPDGSPEVHLEGFGLEDTHAVANNLRWGPDGWLYGAQGSTTIANINSEASKNVYFSGQAIWRYHPESKIFEIFAEGGGNTFDVEIDNKGRIYSGDNGVFRGFYYKQGGYYQKNWGKHGALTNPYAFGYLPGMTLEGEKTRFTHAWIKYEEEILPARYHGKILAINPLHSFVILTRLEQIGSTFLNIDEEKILQSNDHWFRPVDIKSGPDGYIYIADWGDSRLSHVSPQDDWDKKTGRIYRLRGKQKTIPESFDLSTYSSSQLVELLSHKSKWYRQEALRQFGDRKDKSVLPRLMDLINTADAQTSLEALWAINLTGGLSDELALKTLNHTDPYVRSWTIRLLGDQRQVSPKIARELIELAAVERHPEVIGQIASSAKRLPVEDAIPIIENLLKNESNNGDEHNLMYAWWALESKAEEGRKSILALFEQEELWNKPVVVEGISEKLSHRYAVAGGKQNYAACVRLFELAPSEKHLKIVLNGVQKGLSGRDFSEIPDDLANVMEKYLNKFGQGKLSVALRQNDQDAVDEALIIIADRDQDLLERLAYINIFGETDQPKSIPVLLKIASNADYSVAIRLACLHSLRHYDDPVIGEQLAMDYSHKLRSNPEIKQASLSLLASRVSWANEFLDRIITLKQIKTSDIPIDIVKQLKLLDNDKIVEDVDKLWPDVKIATSEEKSNQILKIKNALSSGHGNIEDGKTVYTTFCGSCHRLFDQGGTIGPDLTGYDRSNVNYMALNIVNPNADIREGYVNYKVTKKDGQIILGIMTDRSGGNVTIKQLGGEEITISSEDIEELTAQKTSIMPEHIIKTMTEQQIRDLFVYLAKN